MKALDKTHYFSNNMWLYFICCIMCSCIQAEQINSLEPSDPTSERKVLLHSPACQIKVPAGWTVFDARTDKNSWVITPDNLAIGPYVTGVKIQFIPNVSKVMGLKASAWVQNRVEEMNERLDTRNPQKGSQESGFHFQRLTTDLAYSESPAHLEHYRYITTWYWNDDYNALVIFEARTPVTTSKTHLETLQAISEPVFDKEEWAKRSEPPETP